jgi:rod shape-determining protein MreD
MIKRLTLIFVLSYLFFVAEFVLNGALGPWAKPEFMMVLVVFWGLYSSVRDSIFAAVICGLLKDVFSILPFGTYLFIYIAAAYLTTIVRNTVYQPGSRFSRAVVTFFVLIGCFMIQAFLYNMRQDVHIRDLIFNILLPQLVTTMIVVTFVFQWLRDIAVKLKV